MSTLTTADPATIFISYARKDESKILPIERTLRERGLRVLRDKRNLFIGSNNILALTQMIDQSCDAILFYITDNFINSDFIWQHEIPTALDRWQREKDKDSFRMICIIEKMGRRDCSVKCQGRSRVMNTDFDCAGYDNEVVVGDVPTDAEIRTIAAKTLRSALDLRFRRSPQPDAATGLCFRTFEFAPPADTLHLDVDWTQAFDGAGPQPQDYMDYLLPALDDVLWVLTEPHRPTTADVWLKSRLPAAVAFGYTLGPSSKGSLHVYLRKDSQTWPCDGPIEKADTLSLHTLPTTGDKTHMLVELAISRATAMSISKWRGAAHVEPGWHVLFIPTAGTSRISIENDGQARAWARRIGDEARHMWDEEGVHDAHLFLPSSVEFAFMVGQQLRDRHPVHVYYGSKDTGYTLGCTLGG